MSTRDARYVYHVVDIAGGHLYREAMMERLGQIFELGVHGAGLAGEQVARCFVASGISRQFETQNAKYIVGMSGGELLAEICRKCCVEVAVDEDIPLGCTPEYWLGEMLVYFQTATTWRYKTLFEYLDYEQLLGLYFMHNHETPDEIVTRIRQMLDSRPYVSHLKERRKLMGLTQNELAKRAGVSVRTIQQYEQGAKDITRASAGSLYRMSLVLSCRMEDLL